MSRPHEKLLFLPCFGCTCEQPVRVDILEICCLLQAFETVALELSDTFYYARRIKLARVHFFFFYYVYLSNLFDPDISNMLLRVGILPTSFLTANPMRQITMLARVALIHAKVKILYNCDEPHGCQSKMKSMFSLKKM